MKSKEQLLDVAKNNSAINDIYEEMILPTDILNVDLDSLVNNI